MGSAPRGDDALSVGNAPNQVASTLDQGSADLDQIATALEQVGRGSVELGTQAEQLADEPDYFGSGPDQLGTQPEHVADERDYFGNSPDQLGTQPEHVAGERESTGSTPERTSGGPLEQVPAVDHALENLRISLIHPFRAAVPGATRTMAALALAVACGAAAFVFSNDELSSRDPSASSPQGGRRRSESAAAPPGPVHGTRQSPRDPAAPRLEVVRERPGKAAPSAEGLPLKLRASSSSERAVARPAPPLPRVHPITEAVTAPKAKPRLTPARHVSKRAAAPSPLAPARAASGERAAEPDVGF